MRTTLWSSSNGDITANLAFTNNYDATTNPAVGNDTSQGYSKGSIWINNASDQSFICTDATAGAAVWAVQTEGGTQGQVIAPAAAGATDPGGTALLRGGTGGTTSGAGGPAQVTGGAATAGNGGGGSVVLTGGAKNGTGIAGGVRVDSILIRTQAAPTARTVSGALTGAQLLAGIVTIAQGAGAPSAQQLPTGQQIQDVLPADFAIGESFDVSFINTSTVDAEDASVTVNTDVTIVGSPDIPAHSGITIPSSAMFRFRKTADHAFVAYRIS